MIFVTVSPVQHCLVEEALFPNTFHHEYHRRCPLDQLGAPLVLRCLFDEVRKYEVQAGADTDEADAVPRLHAVNIEESIERTMMYYNLFDLNYIQTRHRGSFVGLSPGLDIVLEYFVETGTEALVEYLIVR